MYHHLCNLWTELSDSSLKGALGFSAFLLRSVFGIGCSLRFADFPSFNIWISVFVKNTCLMGFGFDPWCGFWIFLFGFWFLFHPSGYFVPRLISNSRETSESVPLSTLYWIEWGFENWHEYIYRFCMRFFGFDRIILRLWMIFSTALRFLMNPHPSVQWSSTRILVLHIKNLFLKLQTLRFILFRVLNYSRPCLVISFEILCGIFLIFDFGTESEDNLGWKLGCLCQEACSCICLHYHVLTF